MTDSAQAYHGDNESDHGRTFKFTKEAGDRPGSAADTTLRRSPFFRSDHYLAFGTDGLPGPTDAWVTLGALARETHRVPGHHHRRVLAYPARRDVFVRGPLLPTEGFARPAQAGATASSADHHRGQGKRRSIELAARFADEFNLGWQDVQETVRILDRARAVIDRELVYSDRAGAVRRPHRRRGRPSRSSDQTTTRRTQRLRSGRYPRPRWSTG
jgi:hypothetical protein